MFCAKFRGVGFLFCAIPKALAGPLKAEVFNLHCNRRQTGGSKMSEKKMVRRIVAFHE